MKQRGVRKLMATMLSRNKRKRVVAEITTGYLIQVAVEAGRSIDPQQAEEFLNNAGRAYEMWKKMMYAGESYIKAELAPTSQPVPEPLQSKSLPKSGALYLTPDAGQ